MPNFSQEKLTPSPQLARIIGKKPLTSSEAIAAFWKYVKKNKLQRKNDARYVDCDAALKAVMGAETVTLFEVGPALLAHLSSKARKTKKEAVRYPNEALAMCIGDGPDTVEGMVNALGSDLEEMRWDMGSGAYDSPLIPALEALVEEAGDPYGVDPKSLRELVLANSGTRPT